MRETTAVQAAAPGGRGRSVERAFTLIELLVVVAIIAILAAMLLPALASARERGRAAACISNMKQFGIALTLYADDNKGFFPHRDAWLFTRGRSITTGTLWKYLQNKDIYLCPSDSIKKVRTSSYNPRWRDFSYSMNAYCACDGDALRPTNCFQISRIERPTETFLFMEEEINSPLNDGYVIPNGLDILAYRHNHHGNLLMGDGHVMGMSKEEYSKVMTAANSRFWKPSGPALED